MARRRSKPTQFEGDCLATLGPVLAERGFARVLLRSCMAPEILWRRNTDWIGASFDERDRFLEVDIGPLHWFRDAMRRVVIVDRLREVVDEDLAAALEENDVSRSLDLMAVQFDEIWSRYQGLPSAPCGPGPASKGKYRKEYFSSLGPAVSEEELRVLGQPI